MCWKKLACTFSLLSLLLLASCHLPRGVRITGDSGGLPGQPTSTNTIPGAVDLTFTPSQTPSITLSPTPETPKVTVSVATNCRSGPGEPYDILGALPVGVSAEIVGRNASGDTWIIILPSNPSITCWLWGHYATVTGDTSHLPIYTPPPTPTPSGNFTFSIDFYGVQAGWQCPWFDVSNTGGVTWESFSLTFTNNTDGGSWTTTGDKFIGYDSFCNVTGAQLNLEPGEAGNVSVITWMPSSPLHDEIEATLKLCSDDGLGGYCVIKTITFIFPSL